MRIVLTGGTGFIGQGLVPQLSARGDEVVALSRSGNLPAGLSGLKGVSAVAWDPPAPGAWQECADGADAIVHLAGEQAVGQRYTPAVKERIISSRVRTAERLVEAVAKAKVRPKVFVSASGVGYYGGHSDDTLFDESSPVGDDFLAKVCEQWEGAAHGAEKHGLRVAIARLGVVFGPGGGALETMARPFKLFVGGPIGNGRQSFTWVHRDDAVRALLLLIDDPTCSGPFNVVAPKSVPQGELARTLGKVLGRPAVLPAPSFALKVLFGEGAVPIVTGQNVAPRKLEQRGFEWRFGELEPALRQSLSK
jgi:uncharacterized protein